MTYLVVACQGLLVVVFLASSASKLHGGRALRAFASSLVSMRLVGETAALPVAVAVAGAEAAVVVLLLAPPSARAGLGAAAVLLGLLTAGVALVLARGTAARCRCFGASPATLSRRHLVRNLLLTAAAALAWTAPAGDVPLAGQALALIAGALAGLLVTAMDDLVALFVTSSVEEPRWRT